MLNRKLDKYVASGKNKVQGWFSRCDGVIFLELLKHQNKIGYSGGVAEIGVHHGKSFIALALGNPGKTSYAIDVFDQQEFNIDGSGEGDIGIFKKHLGYFLPPETDVIIDNRPSKLIRPDEIVSKMGFARFFHIDGGHTISDIQNDFILAAKTMEPHGIIAIDDVFRADWPEVGIGLFSSTLFQEAVWTIFAVGNNKVYLSRQEFADEYRQVLRKSDFLTTLYYFKTYQSNQSRIDVYKEALLSETGFKRRFTYLLDLYWPDLAFLLRRRFSKRKRFHEIH